MKRILLTGISGYLGRNLLKSIDQNRYEIYSLQKNTDVKYDGIKQTFTIDDDLESFMLDVCPDTILHLATFHSPKDDTFEIKRMLYENLFLGTRLLATMPSISRFIYSALR
jgi:nucleoside-diphosphate-sugar epimerase